MDKQFRPRFFGGCRVARQRRSLAQRVQGLWHIRLQTIGTFQFYSGFAGLTLLQQRGAQAIGGFGISRLHFGLRAKLFFSFWPLRRAGVNQPELQMQFRRVGTKSQSFEKFFFSLGHLPQHKIVFRQRLMSARRIRIRRLQRVNRLL